MAITPNVEQMKRSPDLGGVGSPSVLQERRAEQNDGVTRESLEAGLHKQRLLLADCGPPVVGHGESRAHAWLHVAVMWALPLTWNFNTFAS